MLTRWALLVSLLICWLAAATATAAQPGALAKVKFRALPIYAAVSPGDKFPIALVMEFQEGWHAWPAAEVQLPPDIAEFAIRTEVKAQAELSLQATLSPVQFPKAKLSFVASPSTGEPIQALTYGGTSIAYLPVTLGPDAKSGSIQIEVIYQACDDKTCLMRAVEKIDVPINVVPAPPAGAAASRTPAEPALFVGFDESSFSKTAAAASINFQLFGWSFNLDPSGAGLAILILLAALGGLLLNFTPCVLPVIPIKIMSLAHVAGDRSRVLLLGSVMSLGVVAFWLAIGVAIASITGFKNISQLFQTPWFAIGVGLFMLAMSVGMLGAYVINLPSWIYAIDPSRESVKGSFGFGLMTGVLSTPCTAPFMGAAAAWAATQAPYITIATFASIGVGMALPYLLLSANPNWIKKLPKTGPGSELLKQVMGIFILAVASFFLGIGLASLLAEPGQPASLLYWWVTFALAAAGALWLVVRIFAISKSPVKRVGFTLAATAVTAGLFLITQQFTDRGPIKWVYYTPAKFDEAKAAGRVIVLDFTADWCLNCKALEATVLRRPEVVALLESPGVVAMKVDLTADNPDGATKLRSLDWVGIPLLAVFGPGNDPPYKPLKFDTYTPTVVSDAIASARGSAAPPTDVPDKP